MSDQSPRLGLPYLLPNQTQTHVTVNQSLSRLAALAQPTVLSRSLFDEPVTPVASDAYILNAGRTGTYWASLPDGAIAVWDDGAWQVYAPQAGWTAFVRDETAHVWFDGSVWRTASSIAADNHLINDTCRLWQRGTTHDLPATAGTYLYTADRWAIMQTATAQGLQEGFSSALVRHRHIPTERLMAQHYFRTWGIPEGDSPAAGTSPSQSVAIAVSAAADRHFVDLPSPMRRAPDIAFHHGAYASGSDSSWNIRLSDIWVNAATTTLEVRTESQLIFEIASTVSEGLSYRTNGACTAEAEL